MSPSPRESYPRKFSLSAPHTHCDDFTKDSAKLFYITESRRKLRPPPVIK